MSKIKKIMSGISSAALVASAAGCGSSSSSDIPPPPTDSQCSNWDWDDDDAVWECEDSSSRYYNHYYHGGTYFPSKTSLKKNSSYKSYKNSISTGFGSGSKSSSFGG